MYENPEKCLVSVFYLRISTFAFLLDWCKKRRAFERLREQIKWKTAREFSQTLPRFSPGYEGTDNYSYFFYKNIILFDLSKRKTLYEARMCSFLSFMKLKVLATRRQLITSLTIFSCFIALYKYTCWRTYYPNYFIICNFTGRYPARVPLRSRSSRPIWVVFAFFFFILVYVLSLFNIWCTILVS